MTSAVTLYGHLLEVIIKQLGMRLDTVGVLASGAGQAAHAIDHKSEKLGI